MAKDRVAGSNKSDSKAVQAERPASKRLKAQQSAEDEEPPSKGGAVKSPSPSPSQSEADSSGSGVSPSMSPELVAPRARKSRTTKGDEDDGDDADEKVRQHAQHIADPLSQCPRWLCSTQSNDTCRSECGGLPRETRSGLTMQEHSGESSSSARGDRLVAKSMI